MLSWWDIYYLVSLVLSFFLSFFHYVCTQWKNLFTVTINAQGLEDLMLAHRVLNTTLGLLGIHRGQTMASPLKAVLLSPGGEDKMMHRQWHHGALHDPVRPGREVPCAWRLDGWKRAGVGRTTTSEERTWPWAQTSLTGRPSCLRQSDADSDSCFFFILKCMRAGDKTLLSPECLYITEFKRKLWKKQYLWKYVDEQLKPGFQRGALFGSFVLVVVSLCRFFF